MGITLCEKHGESGIALICPHLRDSLLSGQALPDYVDLRFRITVKDNDHIEIYPLCQDCLQNYCLPKQQEPLLDWEEWFEKLPLEPVCGLCFLDYKTQTPSRS